MITVGWDGNNLVYCPTTGGKYVSWWIVFWDILRYKSVYYFFVLLPDFYASFKHLQVLHPHVKTFHWRPKARATLCFSPVRPRSVLYKMVILQSDLRKGSKNLHFFYILINIIENFEIATIFLHFDQYTYFFLISKSSKFALTWLILISF